MESEDIKMKGVYLNQKGNIIKRLESQYNLYLIELEDGVKIVAGPSSFEYLRRDEDGK